MCFHVRTVVRELRELSPQLLREVKYPGRSGIHHGLLRVRILSGRLFVKTLAGRPVRGIYFTDRHMAYPGRAGFSLGSRAAA